MKTYHLQPLSEDSMLVEWELEAELPTPADARHIGAVAAKLIAQGSDRIINVTPAFKTLLIQFDVLQTGFQEIADTISVAQTEIIQSAAAAHQPTNTIHQIPVLYDALVAADLTEFCEAKGLSIAQLIEEHSSRLYTVYAVGFQIGFAYLGYVSEKLAMPRHSSFRAKVPAGSVGIADRQTAVYPADSPGGWWIIGRTARQLVQNHHSLMQAGDQVQFVSVDRSQYQSLGGQLAVTK